MRHLVLTLVLVACARPEADSSAAAVPSLLESGGSPADCAGLDYTACTEQPACLWYVNTAPCPPSHVGPGCEPDHCIGRNPGPFDPRMACVCANANTGAPSACVREKGNTALGCEPVPSGCQAPLMTGTDAQTAAACACLSTASRSCSAATDIRALCDCG